MIDLLIVGCGPAGSTAAREARRLGLTVLTLDSETFPRAKTCGGGLSAKIAPYLPPAFDSVVEATIRRVRFEDAERSFEFSDDEPLAYMVMRDRFDAFLASAAREAGAEIRFGEPVRDVGEDGDGVRVQTDCGDVRARWGIGADGAEGIVKKTLFPGRRARMAPALEQELRTAGPAQDADRITIDVLNPPGGYGWIFPKAGRFSAGVAVLRGRGHGLRAGLKRLVSKDGDAAAAAEEMTRGFPIPLYRKNGGPLSSSRWVLAGDAAGLVDPLFGEGIYTAVRSGILAARAVAAACTGAPLSRYDDSVEEVLAPDLRAAGRLSEIVYRFPRWSLGVIRRRPQALRLYAKVLRGVLTYDEMIAAAREEFWTVVKKARFLARPHV